MLKNTKKRLLILINKIENKPFLEAFLNKFYAKLLELEYASVKVLIADSSFLDIKIPKIITKLNLNNIKDILKDEHINIIHAFHNDTEAIEIIQKLSKQKFLFWNKISILDDSILRNINDDITKIIVNNGFNVFDKLYIKSYAGFKKIVNDIIFPINLSINGKMSLINEQQEADNILGTMNITAGHKITIMPNVSILRSFVIIFTKDIAGNLIIINLSENINSFHDDDRYVGYINPALSIKKEEYETLRKVCKKVAGKIQMYGIPITLHFSINYQSIFYIKNINIGFCHIYTRLNKIIPFDANDILSSLMLKIKLKTLLLQNKKFIYINNVFTDIVSIDFTVYTDCDNYSNIQIFGYNFKDAIINFINFVNSQQKQLSLSSCTTSILNAYHAAIEGDIFKKDINCNREFVKILSTTFQNNTTTLENKSIFFNKHNYLPIIYQSCYSDLTENKDNCEVIVFIDSPRNQSTCDNINYSCLFFNQHKHHKNSNTKYIIITESLDDRTRFNELVDHIYIITVNIANIRSVIKDVINKGYHVSGVYCDIQQEMSDIINFIIQSGIKLCNIDNKEMLNLKLNDNTYMNSLCAENDIKYCINDNIMAQDIILKIVIFQQNDEFNIIALGRELVNKYNKESITFFDSYSSCNQATKDQLTLTVQKLCHLLQYTGIKVFTFVINKGDVLLNRISISLYNILNYIPIETLNNAFNCLLLNKFYQQSDSLASSRFYFTKSLYIANDSISTKITQSFFQDQTKHLAYFKYLYNTNKSYNKLSSVVLLVNERNIHHVTHIAKLCKKIGFTIFTQQKIREYIDHYKLNNALLSYHEDGIIECVKKNSLNVCVIDLFGTYKKVYDFCILNNILHIDHDYEAILFFETYILYKTNVNMVIKGATKYDSI